MSSPTSIHNRAIHQFEEVALQPGDVVLITRQIAPGQWRYYRSVVPDEVINGDTPTQEPTGVTGVFLTVGSPEGVVATEGPALAVSAAGALWSRPVATPGNTGWIQLIG